jgi:KDO2-lipid IV(A) lauroyltransferase
MRLLGKFAYRFAVHEREKTVANLRMAFKETMTESQIMDCSKKVFDNLSVCIADAVRLPNLVDGGLDKIIKVEGLRNLTDEIRKGKGVILQTGHFSNWELLGTWLAQKKIPIRVIAKKSYDPRLDKLITGYRNSAGYSNTARGNATQAIIDGLNEGCVYGILFDIDTKVKGVFVNFFNKPAHTAVMPALFAYKYNIPVVPVFIRLNPDYTYTITCRERLQFINTGDEKKDLIINTGICSAAYERELKLSPEHWIWMHERWKKQP